MSTLSYATFDDIERSLEPDYLDDFSALLNRLMAVDDDKLLPYLNSVRPFIVATSEQVSNFTDFEAFKSTVLLESELEALEDIELEDRQPAYFGINDTCVFQHIKTSMAKAKEDVCGICLESFGYGQADGCGNAVSLPCGHVYHEECIRTWVEQQLEEFERAGNGDGSKSSCCFCRADLNIQLIPMKFIGVVTADPATRQGELVEIPTLPTASSDAEHIIATASEAEEASAAATAMVEDVNNEHWDFMQMRANRRKLRRERMRAEGSYHPY